MTGLTAAFRVVVLLLASYAGVVWLASGQPDPTPFLLAAGGFLVALLGVRRLWPDGGGEPSRIVGRGLSAAGIGTCFWAGTLGGGANGVLRFTLVIAAAGQARRWRERSALRAG